MYCHVTAVHRTADAGSCVTPIWPTGKWEDALSKGRGCRSQGHFFQHKCIQPYIKMGKSVRQISCQNGSACRVVNATACSPTISIPRNSQTHPCSLRRYQQQFLPPLPHNKDNHAQLRINSRCLCCANTSRASTEHNKDPSESQNCPHNSFLQHTTSLKACQNQITTCADRQVGPAPKIGCFQ